jgi:hypothetical protein
VLVVNTPSQLASDVVPWGNVTPGDRFAAAQVDSNSPVDSENCIPREVSTPLEP